ncbi:MAG: MFS transporter [Pseudomonadota bacterium]|nr:MFS transporter [Pseudomonadota bacterium]
MAPLVDLPHTSTRRARVSWALFDWAQQPYNMLVVGFVFGPWFVSGFNTDPVQGQSLYGATIGITGLLIAVLSPLLGGVIDAHRNPKTWLALLSIPFVLGCAGLWFAAPGAGPVLAPLIMAALITASVSTELSINAANTMLPYIAEPGRVGRLSGWATGLGYFAALASIGIVLLAFSYPEEPLLGLDKSRGQDSRIAGPFAAIWYLIFVLPLFLFVPKPPAGLPASGKPLAELWRTLKRLRTERGLLWFLLGRMLTGEGMSTAGAFGPILAKGLFGWTAAETGIFGLTLAAVAGISCWLSGMLDDRIGSKRTALIFIALLSAAACGFGLIEADRLFFSVPIDPPRPGDGLFASTGERFYFGCGVLFGAAFGPIGAVLRSWMAHLAPVGEEGRWFGLYALSGRAASFLAPSAVYVLTKATNDQRIVVPIVLTFIAAGVFFLLRAPGRRT